MKVGLFFGSFNPIHTGHLIVANSMLGKSNIDKVWFVVTPQNPLKKRKTLIHEFDRLDMVNAAIYDNYDFFASDIEFNIPKPNYTINTLTYLSSKHPEKEFSLIIGADNLYHFPKWKNYLKILEFYRLLVYPRPNTKTSKLTDHPKVVFIDAPLIDISASYIRKCVKENKSIRYIVPDSVNQIIINKKLYV